ncbi:MAG: FtsX-like permease family protein [Bacteroidia bacterium]|nr:FtsX-like permease family protein [Bacteroidia bacterium]
MPIETTPLRPSLGWAWRWAWRDARRYRSRLLLFLAAITLGVSALVSIQSLSESFRAAVSAESKTLLGADLVLSADQPLSDSLQARVDSLNAVAVRGTSFQSMAQFSTTGGARLAEIRTLEPGYPFYGGFDVTPKSAAQLLYQGPYVLAEESLLVQFGAEVGDSVRIGAMNFAIAGALHKLPGGSSGLGFGSPRIYLDQKYLSATRLIRFGSRVRYFTYLKVPAGVDVEGWEDERRAALNAERVVATTVKDRQEGLGNLFGNLFSFFNLVAFIALLLGGVGVASSVQVYLRERRSTLALLRCLGASGQTATVVYLFQILQVALVGTALGVALGIGLQLAWPTLLEGLLPVPVKFIIAWPSVALGAGVGLGLSLLFALLPLVRTRRVSPLVVLRADYEPRLPREPWTPLLLLAIGLAVVGFAAQQLRGWQRGLVYTIALVVALGVLAGVAWALMRLVRVAVPRGAGFALKQGLSGLYRPRNQTLVLVVTLGLGTLLLGVLFFVQENLQQQVRFNAQAPDRPNLVLFDIQTSQVAGVDSLLKRQNIARQEMTPVVTVRMDAVRGRPFAELKADSTLDIPWWAGEYRVSYRDTLMASERVVRGTWHGKPVADTLYVSVATQLADIFKLQVGDAITFNVQGVRFETRVGSVRTIDFLSGSSSFQILFPAGVLEKAPQFWVATALAPTPVASATLQRTLVETYPNVSVVDIRATLVEAQELLGQIGLIIQFLATFSLLTGLVVLTGALVNSRAQRVKESVLLRTLGASTRQLLRIQAIEYLLLGTLAAVSGLVLAYLASWLMTEQVFKTTFAPSLWVWGVGIATVAGLTLLLGLVGNYRLVRVPPLAILRETAEQ